ncbi:hypothetical protein [Emticicia sp. W12TSBA100-4]|uniref:hypothetical protein n=1 Tax=Emticicia sp. W12TSBA100-4 TaxID=3160965 RepID=UPI003306785D
MRKVFSTSILAILFVLGIATSCKESALQPQTENQPVVNVSQPQTDLEVSSAATSNPNARAAADAVFCQCVKYVKNKTGVANPASAKDYGKNLKDAGYYEVTPDFTSTWGNIWASDVLVVSNNYGSGVNSTHGHVGFPSSVTRIQTKDKNGKVTSQYFVIKIKGSNQTNDPKKVFTDAGCNNVDVNMTVYYYPGNSTLKFYRK